MTVLDAYAVLAYLRGEGSADEVEKLLRQPTSISAANIAEVFDQLVRIDKHDPDDVHAEIAILASSGVSIVPVSSDLGLLAGRLRAQHYRSKSLTVSLADCLAAATSLSLDQSLATSDPDLASMLRAEGGAVHPLPDSTGRRP